MISPHNSTYPHQCNPARKLKSLSSNILKRFNKFGVTSVSCILTLLVCLVVVFMPKLLS